MKHFWVQVEKDDQKGKGRPRSRSSTWLAPEEEGPVPVYLGATGDPGRGERSL